MSKTSALGPTGIPAVIIVGGGFSGAAVALQLMRQSPVPSFQIVIVSSEFPIGQGVAYGKAHPGNLLNVPTKDMSVFSDEPNHFLDWVSRHDGSADPFAFVPRKRYGEYIHETLQELAIPWKEHSLYEELQGEVTAIERTAQGYEVTLHSGAQMLASSVVLATGHEPSQIPSTIEQGIGDGAVFEDPWAPEAFQGLDQLSHILVLGSGLTAVDVVGELHRRGYAGSISLLSRRGLLPQLQQVPPTAVEQAVSETLTLRQRVRSVRQRAQVLQRESGDWRPAIDELRSVLPTIWARFSARERGTFLRHVRPRWDAVRHRMPPQVGASLARLQEEGRLRVVGGRISKIFPTAGSANIEVQYATGSERKRIFAQRIINCTGPGPSGLRTQSALLKQLVRNGLLAPDALSLGFSTTARSRIGDGYETLHLAGPLRRGELWESTAVRELRDQASAEAREVIAAFNSIAGSG